MLSETDDRPKSGGSTKHDLRDCFEQRWEWIRIRASVLLAAEGITLKVSSSVRYCLKIFICCGITLYVLNLNYINVTIIESPFSWNTTFGDIDPWSGISNIFHILTNKMCKLKYNKGKSKGKAVPLQAWSGPEGSRKLRFPDYMTTAQDGGKVVNLTHRQPLPPGNTPGTHFC